MHRRRKAFLELLNYGYIIPSGAIIMWAGTLASIPSGYSLCDGTNGTPDLRDKFIKGWQDGVNPGGIGGNLTHTHAAHAAGVTGLPSATNTVPTLIGANLVPDPDDEHTHTTPELPHDTVNHEPPYFKLAFIQKI